ncbi:MAG TPA: MMPL family transporter [Lapillicoccus sp.]|nr:MMPL family transporter [Lapillicoccus sp.]
MATLLYRLGRFCARRARLVVVAWVLLLGLAGTAYALGHGTLSSAVSIPGTATSQVTDQLRDALPAASGGTGTMVFHTSDGTPFTEQQRSAISAALAEVGSVDGVRAVTDPFQTAAQLATQQQQVEEGRTALAAGTAQLEAGQAQIDQARQQLDAAKAQAQQAGVPAPQPVVDGLAQLDAQQQVLDQKKAEAQTQGRRLELGASLLDLSRGIRTVSADNSAAIGVVAFEGGQMEVPPEVKDAVVAHVEQADLAGAQVDFSTSLTQGLPEVVGPGEIAGLVVAGITLLVMLGTLVAAGLPLVSALVGVGFGLMATLAFSGTVEMLSVTPVLGLMLGLAVGIDYSLFILNRHRRQLRAGVDLHASIGLANGTSGNAVVFAGATVIVALLALNVTGIPFLGMMGITAAVCIATAVAVAVTFTPALLALLGRRLLPRRQRSVGGSGRHRPPTEPMSTGRAVLTLVGGVAVLVALALPALSMRLGLPDGATEPAGSTQNRAYLLAADRFGPGANGPLLVVATLPAGVTADEVLAQQVRVGTAVHANGDVAAVAPIGQSTDGKVLAFQVVPKDGPNSQSTEELVRDLRAMSPLDDGTTLGVAGSASGNIDISEKLAEALPVYLAVVVGLSFVIMVLVFRSLLVPLTATLGFVMSLFAAFGGVVAIFQWGWLEGVFHAQPGPILSFLPTLLVGILFGLAMDYQLFLVTGMREAYVHGAPARVAVRQGLSAGRVVVTAAAIIMISVFAGFVFSNSATIRPLGFGLAFGVLVDAFVVRMLLIPATMHLAGDAAWWLPRWLDRILPDVDVEGAELERSHPLPASHASSSKEELAVS